MNLAEFQIPFVALIFTLLLDVIYFSRRKIKITENLFYDAILITATVFMILNAYVRLICSLNTYEVILTEYYDLLNLFNKVFSLIGSIFFSLFFSYTLIISYDIIKKNKNKLIKAIVLFNVLIFIILQFTNIELTYVSNVTNVTGPTIFAGYIVAAICMIASFIVAVLNFKKLDRRYMPIFVILLLVGAFYPISLIFKGLILYDLTLSLTCYIMYFTIENPDIKMVEEVSNAKDKIEKYSNDKSIFIFNTNQQLRYPLNIIDQRAEQLISLKDDDVTELANDIKYSVQKINNVLNGTLNIDVIDVNKVKVVDTKYKVQNILDRVILTNKNKIEQKNIEFILDIDETLPEELYGDGIRLKQVIDSIMSNAIKYTDKGFIELSVSSIIKYDICRLIIRVKDSGSGMKPDGIDRINTIKNDDFAKETDQEDLTLATAKKLLNMIGGTITIDSVIGKGTEVSIYIDQRIYTDKDGINMMVKRYKRGIRPQILVVSEDNDYYDNLLKKHYNIVYANDIQRAKKELKRNNNLRLMLIEQIYSESIINDLKKIISNKFPIVLYTNDIKNMNNDGYKTIFKSDNDLLERITELTEEEK